MDAREEAIQSTIRGIISGVFPSQRAAAKAYNLPQSTISTRINGRQSNYASYVY